MKPERILIAPLDWGLGHASRCIPIIRTLLGNGYHVMIGGSGSSLTFLQKEFPALHFEKLPSYDPEYPKGAGMVRKMLLQTPKFLKAINMEHQHVEELIKRYGIDLVISDNRFGCWSELAKTIFITHQSNILMPKRFGFMEGVVRRFNEFYMNKFDLVWIPDEPGDESMAGDLLGFGRITFERPVHYLGALTRFSPGPEIEKKRDIVAVCSGPEPQRTILEKLLMQQLKQSGLRFLLVRGVFEGEEKTVDDEDTIVNYLTSVALQRMLCEAELVISRSGYSTVMDLSVLRKKAIFIPTPGQTEQEYLAKRLEESGVAFYMRQGEFNLRTALQEATRYSGFIKDFGESKLEQVIDKSFQSIFRA